MQRFASNLVIANKMDIKVTSEATYSESEQTEIRNNQRSGLWPFYVSGSSSGSSTESSFDASGKMTVRITSEMNVPVIIGCIVLSAGQYLGHEAQASKMLTERFYG